MYITFCSLIVYCSYVQLSIPFIYFVYKFIYEKHGITDSFNAYIPTRLNSFVSALGGISNIIRFKNDGLEVRNPKLIDTVSLDCEIKENFVTTKDKRMIELKEYL